VEVQRPHELLEPQVVGTARRTNLQPTGLPFGKRLDAVAPEDLVQWFGHGGRNLSDPLWGGS